MEEITKKDLRIHSMPILILAIVFITATGLVLSTQENGTIKGQLLESLLHRSSSNRASQSIHTETPGSFIQAGQMTREIINFTSKN